METPENAPYKLEQQRVSSHESIISTSDGRPLKRIAPKVGRNAPCICGSGIKSKKCCVVC